MYMYTHIMKSQNERAERKEDGDELAGKKGAKLFFFENGWSSTSLAAVES